jgi:hypothetical protein
MQTDSTEAKADEGGFTQAWDTVGAGANHPMPERAYPRGALSSTMKLSDRYRGKQAPAKQLLSFTFA